LETEVETTDGEHTRAERVREALGEIPVLWSVALIPEGDKPDVALFSLRYGSSDPSSYACIRSIEIDEDQQKLIVPYQTVKTVYACSLNHDAAPQALKFLKISGTRIEANLDANRVKKVVREVLDENGLQRWADQISAASYDGNLADIQNALSLIVNVLGIDYESIRVRLGVNERLISERLDEKYCGRSN